MKKAMALFLAAVMSLSLFGCGKSKLQKQAEDAAGKVSDMFDELGKAQEEQKRRRDEIKDTFENKQRKIEGAVFDILDYDGENMSTIKLKSFVVVGSEYEFQADDRYLILTLDYTNNQENDSFFVVNGWGFEAYQDGVKLNHGHSNGFDKEQTTQIKKGKTIEVVCTINLRNDTSDAEFEVGDETVYTLKIK